MVRTVKLSRSVPRDLAAIRAAVDLHVHLRSSWLLGGSLLALAGLPATIAARRLSGDAAFDPPTWGFLALALGLLLYGGSLLIAASAKLRFRRRLFVHGKLGEAEVRAHETATRRSALGFRRTVYLIRAEVALDSGKRARGVLETGLKAMTDALPVGSALPALVDEERGDLLFPHELVIAVEPLPSTASDSERRGPGRPQP